MGRAWKILPHDVGSAQTYVGRGP